MQGELESQVAPRHVTCLNGQRRSDWLCLLVLLLLAGLTRFVGLTNLDLWGDEVYSYTASTNLIRYLLLWETPENPEHSPLHFLEIKAARHLTGGDGTLGVRLPSAIYGVLAVGLFFLWARRYLGLAGAAAGAAFLIFNPFALEWSREGRMYSGLLFWTLAAVAMADHTLHHLDTDDSPLDWRWWAQGLVWMTLHASAVFGLMSILAIGGWIVLTALSTAPANLRRTLRCLAGLAVSTTVFITSWSLAGLAKLTNVLLAPHLAGQHVNWFGALGVSLRSGIEDIAGTTSLWAIGLMLALLAGGLAVLARCGRTSVALLLLLLGLTPWLIYPGVVQRHFWTGRYIYITLIPFAAGVGALLGAMWEHRGPGKPWVLRTAALAIGVLILTVWAPRAYALWTVPYMQVRQALQPIFDYAQPGDVIVTYPHSYYGLAAFPPYDFRKKVALVTTPIPLGQGPAAGITVIKRYQAIYERLFAAHSDQPLPPGTWLFLVNAKPEIAQSFGQMLARYGLTETDLQNVIPPHALTLTLRVSVQGISHVTVTQGRPES